MRINEPVTNRQRDYRDDQKIVSTTDSKGLITDVNQDFIEISGFTRDELIGQAHNMVRHPWMPQAAFAELWQHNKSNKPWMGMVKNRCKNGDHYWVDAFVTSMLEDGQSVGYQSVRQKPKQEWIDRATDFYENKFNPIDQLLSLWQGRSLAVKLFVAFSLVTVFCGLLWWMNMPPAMVVAAALLGNGIFSFLLAKPWSDYAREMESVFKSDIAKKIYTGRSDELGQVQLIHKFFQSQQDTILYRSSNVAEDVKARAFAAYNESKKTTNEIDLMYEQVESVSSAINEMSETVHAVADNAGATSSAADESKQGVTTGKNILMDAKKAMDDLVNAVDKSAVIIQRLSEDSAQIGSVVDVINGIAEQTNLLALNAAIEAARAGEQGRGFAVVADEVRALAAKTQESTGQISEMISTLQGGAAEAVNSIATSHSQVNISVESIDNLEKHFATILENVDKITDMCVSTASATEQQSAVAENINNNIVKINQTGKNTMASMQGVNKNNEALEKISEKMNVMIEQFKFN